ncbi:MAG TPA: tRNA preQ1(34) S-adenosylmethionine ribosyltransferase-isomerase QueA [Candidatus Saccharimonadales bacterium]|nr:tRNA preQ1(34) S-adenosylmethionine ribosyltransferase-isomerase QueA [Candidatus Saccharimonadales bacterium]
MPTNIIYVVLISEFDFHLPGELIAQEPLALRSASRMLFLRQDRSLEDCRFVELPSLLKTKDLIVINNSRVLPARLFGHRAGLNAQPVSDRNVSAGSFLRGQVEVLLTRQTAPWEWQALVKPGRKIAIGETIYFGTENDLQAEITGRGEFGERTLRFQPVPDFFATIGRLGHVPLPPYIDRPDRPEDRERYQTVYAQSEATGSVAAPTAGLHFTPEVLSQIRGRGVEIAEITLHVGLGTFQPVRVEKIEDHRIHREPFSIAAEAAEKINRALREKCRIVAVGTTTVRTLEYAARQGSSKPGDVPQIGSGAGEADIFIYPGFEFRVTGALLTNFHLPKSTLLMLVSALAGRENVLRAYRHAVQERYRFFSYGDCMFVEGGAHGDTA